MRRIMGQKNQGIFSIEKEFANLEVNYDINAINHD
jgi:hypothetical protein